MKCHLYKLLLPFRPSGQHLTHFPSDQGSAEAITPQHPSALCQLLLPNWTRTLGKLQDASHKSCIDAWGSTKIEPQPKQAFFPLCCMVRTFFLLCPRTAFPGNLWDRWLHRVVSSFHSSPPLKHTLLTKPRPKGHLLLARAGRGALDYHITKMSLISPLPL